MKKTNALRLLQQKKISFETIPYHYDPENLNVQKIADENALPLAAIYKTLIAKGDKTGPLVALIAGDRALSFKKLAQQSQNKKIALVPIKNLQKLTGYIRGGCSPIGMKRDFDIYADESFAKHDYIYLNAGTRGLLMKLNPQDLEQICAIHYGDISTDL